MIIDIQRFNNLFELNIAAKTKKIKVVRARQAVWLFLYINGHSYSKIGKIFNLSHSVIIRGIDRFENEIKREMYIKQKIATKYWELIKNEKI